MKWGIAVVEILVGILLFVVLLVVCSVLVSEYLFKMIIYRQKKSSCQKDIDAVATGTGIIRLQKQADCGLKICHILMFI